MGLDTSLPAKKALSHFLTKGEMMEITPFGSGHIHDTYLVTLKDGESQPRLILQKVNHQVFTRTALVCENIKIVSDHIRQKLGEMKVPDIDRRCMQIIPDKERKPYFQDSEGIFWRIFTFIEETEAINEVANTTQAYEAARAIGEFQLYLSDLDAESIGESIPRFHHIGWRYENLEKAILEDFAGRVKEAQEEIVFARKAGTIKTEMLDLLARKVLPIRVVHNDTKINNVLFDRKTGKAICVIDLDTVMPGSVIYDFGDMVRTFTSPAAEDETDLSRVFVRLEIYQALVEGYLAGAGSFITSTERKNLVLGAKVITLIMGIRFLTDYLNGDIYYKIHYPKQNLNRCRNQFQLLKDILEKENEMSKMILPNN